jgi:uncharacterized protein (DUF1330 family)
MNDKATLVVTAAPNPNEREAMQAYLKGVLPLVMGAGGQLVKRLQVEDVLSGTQDYGMVLVIDFESKEKISSLFASDEYKALIPVRDRGFTRMNISITGGL